MYPVPDDDLDLLESYLDDALDEAQTQSLRARLAEEANLAAALRQLREERSQRQGFFQSIEPTPREIEQLVSSIRTAATKRRWWQDQMRLVRVGSAMAACLVIAGFAGVVYRSASRSPVSTTPLISNVSATPNSYPVEVTDEEGHVIAVQHFDNQQDASDFQHDLKQMESHWRQQKSTRPSRGDF